MCKNIEKKLHLSFSAIQTLARFQHKRSGLLLSYFVCLPFFSFLHITAVGSFKLICMKWKLYRALSMFSRISNKSSSRDVMHTILSTNSAEQNCSRRFLSWLASCLHHYIINFFHPCCPTELNNLFSSLLSFSLPPCVLLLN